jgi:CheY-like chemotaxis protein
MEPFQVFEENLLEMLNHIYDPVYRPPESLGKVLHIPRESGLQALRDAILAGIEDLKPTARVPLTARAWRVYGMLRYRYVEGLSQELTAEKLGISARHLRRNFLEAVHALSLTLWEKSSGELTATPESQGAPLPDSLARSTEAGPSPHDEVAAAPAAMPVAESELGWHEQLLRELEALEETAAGAVSNVAETVQSALRLAIHLTQQRGILLMAEPISPRLMASIHPSALRQILISVIDQLTKPMKTGEIRLTAGEEGGQVQICLFGEPMTDTALKNIEAIRELLSSVNIALAVRVTKNIFQLTLELLQVDRCVLSIDDNTDMAHLYRRYLAGTRYYLQHVNRAEKAFEAIDLYHPDLVVLDVMLPDIDGWDLLTRLHENPRTRPLPVLICSVMREKELAQALGARYFLTKPVQRQDFIHALDTILQQV